MDTTVWTVFQLSLLGHPFMQLGMVSSCEHPGHSFHVHPCIESYYTLFEWESNILCRCHSRRHEKAVRSWVLVYVGCHILSFANCVTGELMDCLWVVPTLTLHQIQMGVVSSCYHSHHIFHVGYWLCSPYLSGLILPCLDTLGWQICSSDKLCSGIFYQAWTLRCCATKLFLPQHT